MGVYERERERETTTFLLCVFLGFVAVFNFHKVAKIPDMYSLHSWVGMSTLVIFFLQVHTHTHTHTIKCCDWNSNIPFVSFSSQWVIGLLFFLFPFASSWLRALYLPIHVFCGLGLLVMSIGTCLLGITEKLLFSLYVRPSTRAPSFSCPQSRLTMTVNSTSVFLCASITLSLYLWP